MPSVIIYESVGSIKGVVFATPLNYVGKKDPSLFRKCQKSHWSIFLRITKKIETKEKLETKANKRSKCFLMLIHDHKIFTSSL